MHTFLRNQAFKLHHAAKKHACCKVELAMGRSAIVGLLSTSVVGNVASVSLLTQYHNEAPLVWATVAAITALTIKQGDFVFEDKKIEINAGRQAMVVMLLLALMEA